MFKIIDRLVLVDFYRATITFTYVASVFSPTMHKNFRDLLSKTILHRTALPSGLIDKKSIYLPNRRSRVRVQQYCRQYYEHGCLLDEHRFL